MTATMQISSTQISSTQMSSTTKPRASFKDGLRFQSTRVAKRWRDLRARELAGEIQNLKARPRFELKAWSPSGAVGGSRYTADFSYLEDGCWIVEDVRRPDGDRGEMRSLARWLIRANHPDIKLREV